MHHHIRHVKPQNLLDLARMMPGNLAHIAVIIQRQPLGKDFATSRSEFHTLPFQEPARDIDNTLGQKASPLADDRFARAVITEDAPDIPLPC